MIYECTDCSNCANFDNGWRVICLSDELIPEAVDRYYPVGDGDAGLCPEFDETYNFAFQFSFDHWDEAEKFSVEKYGEVTYQGIRDWCTKKLSLDK